MTTKGDIMISFLWNICITILDIFSISIGVAMKLGFWNKDAYKANGNGATTPAVPAVTPEQQKKLDKDNWFIKVVDTCTKPHEFESMERDLIESAAEYSNIPFLKAYVANKRVVVLN